MLRHERLAPGPLAARGLLVDAGRARPRRRRRPTTARCTSSPGTKASRCRSSMDEEGLDPDALELPGRVPVHDPDLPEPERPHALARAPPAARRARPRRASCSMVEDDPYCARPLRGRAAAEHLRARGRRGRRLLVLVLEDRRAGPARRLPRRPGGADRAARGARRPDLSDARRCCRRRPSTSSSRAGCLEPNLERVVAAAQGAARRDARGVRAGAARGGDAGAGRRAATSRGSTSPPAPMPPSCSPAARSAGVTFVAGQRLLPAGRGGEGSARLAFSFVSPAEIATGVARLAALLRELRSSPVAV